MNDKKTTRRRFLVASIAFSGCAFGTMGASMLRISATWAESRGKVDRETLNAMIRMARMLFPHDALSDEIYGDVLDSALSGAATDPSFAESLNAAEKALDAARPGNWIDLDESEQLAAMHDVEGMGFFAAIQGAVMARFYNHPKVWEHIGYPGSSVEYGGYVDRGFDDIDWLSVDA